MTVTPSADQHVSSRHSGRWPAIRMVDALNNAAALRRSRPTTTVVHTPIAAAQFRSHAFLGVLRAHSMRGPMGRVGTCADNAAIVLQPFCSTIPATVTRSCMYTVRC
jgi:transposase InsO family protein